ncbi:hypothetical protein [Halosegnis sp.]|uniref:hypothetical protein n=1 Tax=Halosegnis sp. TaxID=2864959 RepID=UPI0035D43D48
MVQRPTFDALSDVMDACESHDSSVQSVEVAMGSPEVTVELVVDHTPRCADDGLFAVEAAGVAESGHLEVEFTPPSLTSLLPDGTPVTAEQVTDVAATDEGRLRCSHELTFRPEPEPKATDDNQRGHSADERDHSTVEAVADGGAITASSPSSAPSPEFTAIRDESVPPYKDTEYLAALYESCATFEEMSRHIEMDVVAETVRRYMVDAGIHTPDSYETTTDDTEGDTGEQADASVPELPDESAVADVVDLPTGVSVSDIVDAVVDATTVYEVTRALGVGQNRTRELLAELGLLEQVMHRLTDDHRGRSREAVIERIQERCADESGI